MNWITDNKDVLTVIIAAGSLIVSIFALIRTNKTASATHKIALETQRLERSNTELQKLNTKLQQSNTLSELHDKMRPGRQAMEIIWLEWNADKSKQIGDLRLNNVPIKFWTMLLNIDCLAGILFLQQQKFIQFYNTNYHHAFDSRNADLSDAIHTYLSELNSIWHRIENREFDQQDVMGRLGDGIFLDRHFIKLYLLAHWQGHKQLQKDEKDRFWNKVNTIVREAEDWKCTKTPYRNNGYSRQAERGT